jgi:hypothetical protein
MYTCIEASHCSPQICTMYVSIKKKIIPAWWHKPVVPASREAEVGGLGSKTGVNLVPDLIWNKERKSKSTGGVARVVDPEFSPQFHKQTKQIWEKGNKQVREKEGGKEGGEREGRKDPELTRQGWRAIQGRVHPLSIQLTLTLLCPCFTWLSASCQILPVRSYHQGSREHTHGPQVAF